MKNSKIPKKDFQIDREKIKDFLDNAVKQIRTEEDPQELNEYRKIFRESVPFSLRSYFAAYMIKADAEGRWRSRFRAGARERASFSASSERKPRQAEAAQHKGPRTPIPTIPEDEASTVFLSVGRKRNVFPKDIIYMIMHNSGIERSHIGEIKILDNCSFVQVLASDAQKVIDALSGIEYRGKSISASFARKTESFMDPPGMEREASHGRVEEEAAAEAPQEAAFNAERDF